MKRLALATVVLLLGIAGCGESQEEQAIDAYNRGVDHDEVIQRDDAIADYTEAIRLNPKYTEAYCKRGGVYSMKGQRDDAIADYTEAIRLNPKYTEAYYGRAFTYSKKGEYDKAIADCTIAINLDPTCAKAYAIRGYVYHKKGELLWRGPDKQFNQSKAAADFAKARKLGWEPLE